MMLRSIIKISGPDRVKFLQGLVTNDLRHLSTEGIIYAAILSPQGKYLVDFFIVVRDDVLLIDVAQDHADDLLRRLMLYKLRSDVTVEQLDMPVSRGTGSRPEGAHPDPRHPALGWRIYGAALPEDGTDWDALRVAHCIPETGVELIPNDTYILEAGFERLNGVDFRKGCYVGQEVTARMHHKTSLRKGFTTVTLDGETSFGTEIRADTKPVGQVFTRAGDQAIAYMRFDRADGPLFAGRARVMLDPSVKTA
ncbi:MAG: folate-binding protein [Rhodobacteraceae bacterium]|nr:MAG: folate-binding protein [Paracoccaceae bacterium]